MALMKLLKSGKSRISSLRDKLMLSRADIMADSAYEWFEKCFMKYSILMGMDKMSMKSEDKLQRWESLKGMMGKS